MRNSMKKVLFIRPDSREDGDFMWCESGSDQVETLTGWQSLTALAKHALSAQVCLLLPASEMTFRHFTLPKRGLSLQANNFSWMAEETLIGEVDGLHWTILNKKGREVDAVAIDAVRLRHWLTLMSDAGLGVVQVLPDAILLPVTEGGCTIVAVEDGYWLRISPFNACEVNTDLLPLLITKCGAGETHCYGEIPLGIQVDKTLPWVHPLVLIQPQWRSNRANLLHGDFLPHRDNPLQFRHMKAVMLALTLLFLGLLTGPRIALAWMLTHHANQARSEIEQVVHHYFPTLRKTTNIKYEFGQNVTRAKKGVFLQLEAMMQAKESCPEVEIQQVAYDRTENQLTLQVASADQQALQTFVSQASEAFELTIQPISLQAPYTAIVVGKYK